MTRRQLLVQARDLLDKEGWIRGAIWRPGLGRCAVGGLIGVLDRERSGLDFAGGTYTYAPEGSRNLFWDAIEALEVHTRIGLVAWNNDPRRTKEQVLAVFDAAIAAEPPDEPAPLKFEVEEREAMLV